MLLFSARLRERERERERETETETETDRNRQTDRQKTKTKSSIIAETRVRITGQVDNTERCPASVVMQALQ